MQDDRYRKRLTQRTRHILRGPVEVAAAVVSLLIIFSRPLMDWVLEVWEGLPWWVGAFLLVFLVSYALVRAGYELWREEEQARKKALRDAEQEREKLERELEAAQAKTGSTLGYEKLVAELERVRGERDEFERKLTIHTRNKPLRDRHLKNEAKWEYLREVDLSEIKELKQRCLELANELYRFLEERRHGERDDLEDPEMSRRSDETVELYREHFMDKVNALREDLEQRKLWGDGVIDLHGRDVATNPPNYLIIRAIAGHLDAIANRL